MGYLVALGAPTSFDRLRRALDAVCPDVEVREVQRSHMRAGFPETDNVVLVTARDASDDFHASGAMVGAVLVSHRHTPTTTLRRMVRQVAREFGSARLLIRHGPSGPPQHLVPVRTQTTTLAGFLRSGRVVQDDTLLTIVPT